MTVIACRDERLTKRQRDVLKLLSDGRKWTPHQLGTSAAFLQKMFYADLVDGAGLPDGKGYGNTVHSSVWWITKKGRDALGSP
jgi:hypothetical protein